MTTSTRWQLTREAAEHYERVLVPVILGPAAVALVDHVAPRHGDIILDAGCGTGAAARYAATHIGASGRVIGIDVNPGMIDVAQSLPAPPGAAIQWQVASANDLPLPDDSVDLVLCAQTLQFIQDPVDALGEMRRVLRLQGRVAISTWSGIGGSPYFDSLAEAISRHVGSTVADGLRAAFRLADVGSVEGMLSAAGFVDVAADLLKLDINLPALRDFIPRHVGATPMSAAFSSAPPAIRNAVVEDIVRELADFAEGDGVRVPVHTHVLVAAA